MRDSLIELLCETLQDGCEGHCNYPPCSRCKIIADSLLANGWIRPPCKPGDTLWYLDYGMPKCFREPERIIVQDIVITAQAVLIRCNHLITLRIEDFGRIAFTSKEVAEEALRKDYERE